MFKQSSLDVWLLYKESMRACEASYIQGKEDAFAEIIAHLAKLGQSTDFRYLPLKDFVTYLEDMYAC